MTLEEIKSKLPQNILDNNIIFILNGETKELINVDETSKIMQYDNGSQAISIIIPRVIGGHDMCDCNAGSVHWRIIDSKTGNPNSGVIALGNYIDESTVESIFEIIPGSDNDDKLDDILHTEFRFKDSVTQYSGAMIFAVRFERNVTDDKGLISNKYRFVTDTNKSITIVPGLDSSASVEEEHKEVFVKITEKFNEIDLVYKDHISDFEAHIDESKNTINTTVDAKIEEVKDEVTEELKENLETYVDETIAPKLNIATDDEVSAIFNYDQGYYDPGLPSLPGKNDYYVYSQIDDELTADSEYPVKSKAIYVALQEALKDVKVDLTGYATEDFVNEIIKNIDVSSETTSFEVVDELPTENIRYSTLYILRNTDNTTLEYWMYKETEGDGPDQWECIGSTAIDPTRFATDDEVTATLFSDGYESGDYYIYIKDINEELKDYVKTEDLDELIGSGGNIEIDTELSFESENPVQNKVITEALDEATTKIGFLEMDISHTSSIADEAFYIALGANKAIGVENYEELVNLLNGAPDFVVGQNFYVKTLNVPDMWIYSVEDSGVYYTYVDDASIIAATTEAPLQIGTYKIAQLETLKTDLTNYAKLTDLDGKLDKVTSQGGNRLYTINSSGGQGVISFTQSPGQQNIAQFDGKGRLSTNDPISDLNCVNKRYVDDAIANASSGSGSDIEIDNELSFESENAVQNKVITEALDTKLDKVTSDGIRRLYGIAANGSTWTPRAETNEHGGSIALRDGNGRMRVAHPSNGLDCANKKYVDDAIANASSGSSGGTQLYRHRVTVTYAIDPDGNTEPSHEIAFLSKRSTAFTNEYLCESCIGMVDGIFEYENVYRVTVVNNQLFFILSIGGDLSNGEFIFDGLSTNADGMIYLENPKQEAVGQNDYSESIYGIGYFISTDSSPYGDASTWTITDVVTKY